MSTFLIDLEISKEDFLELIKDYNVTLISFVEDKFFNIVTVEGEDVTKMVEDFDL